jgi:hypothetical protein
VTTLVLDARVIVKWILAHPGVEPHTDRALHVLDGIRALGAVALAHTDAVLVTADERYYCRASRLGQIVRLSEVSLAAR